MQLQVMQSIKLMLFFFFFFLIIICYESQVKKMSTDLQFILDALQSSTTVEVQVRFFIFFSSLSLSLTTLLFINELITVYMLGAKNCSLKPELWEHGF